MKSYHLALLGFGNVGRALAGLLKTKTAELRDRYGIGWKITGVASRRIGWLANPDGFDVDALLANNYQSPITAVSIQEWLSASRADVLFENSSLNPLTGQPAIDHVKAGLEHGAHVVTAMAVEMLKASASNPAASAPTAEARQAGWATSETAASKVG